MKRAYYRVLNAIKVAWWAFMNPDVLTNNTFKMLSSLYVLILKVAQEDRHMMTHIAFIHPEDGTEHQIVSIWAGAGEEASPNKRIAELLAQNEELKEQIKQLTTK